MSGDIGEINQEIQSVIKATFAAPTSVLVQVETQNVTPGQLIFLGHYLLEKGNYLMRQKEEEDKRKAGLAKPPQGLILPTK